MTNKIKQLRAPFLVIVGFLAIAGVFIILNQEKIEKVETSPEDLAQKAIDYINENMLSEGLTASLVNVVEESGLYKIHLEIGGEEYDSYISKDGKLLFPQNWVSLGEESVTQAEENVEESTQQQSISCEDVQKKQKSVLEAFVVSYCPFGTQMQRILVEVVKNIPELAENIKIEYMGEIQDEKITSMHGEEEAQENLTQICLREEESSKYFPYLSCFLKNGDNETCLRETGIDLEKLEGCKNDGSRGLTYAQRDFDLQDKYNVTGSPALILNEQKVSEFDFGGRTAEAVKSLLCCGFEGDIAYCSKTLTKEESATGFSETYSSGESSDGSCQ